MNKQIIFLCLFILSQLTAFSQSLEDIILESISEVEKGNFTTALEKYNLGISKYPNEPVLYVLKGELFTKYNRKLTMDPEVYNNALEQYNLALEIDSTYAPAYNSRGLLNVFHQKFDLAISDFTNVLKYAEDDAEIQFNVFMARGGAKSYSKDYKGAIADYNEAIKIRPNSAGIYINLGAIHANLKDYKKAEKNYQKALEIEPENGYALNNFGMFYIRQKNYNKAVEILQQAIKITSDDPLLHNNLGFAKLKLGEPDDALILINKSISIYPQNSYAFKNRALVYIAKNEIEKACADLTKANELGYSITYNNEVNELLDKNNCKD
ncbi:tetratricopeptide repeat protein [Chondrinema litorale]|uniref:tetratricopeptide repeat protein n=1 Tax=Chondrinema litorale TaxID=2994555 RepID=UPI0025427B1D|nr:tetratricopeptide repeat protein [Chondrinema litorale]UZR93819.1 tetratricopeptide repeat protein [Chondrinema litorale]